MVRPPIRNAGLLGLLVVAFAFAACGGNDEPGDKLDEPDDKLSAYLDDFETVRVEFSNDTSDLPGIGATSSLSDARQFFNGIIAAEQRRITAMERFDRPATLAEPHDQLLQAMRELLDFNTRVRDRVAAMTDQAELAEIAGDRELGTERSRRLSASLNVACTRLQSAESDGSAELSCDFGASTNGGGE